MNSIWGTVLYFINLGKEHKLWETKFAIICHSLFFKKLLISPRGIVQWQIFSACWICGILNIFNFSPLYIYLNYFVSYSWISIEIPNNLYLFIYYLIKLTFEELSRQFYFCQNSSVYQFVKQKNLNLYIESKEGLSFRSAWCIVHQDREKEI